MNILPFVITFILILAIFSLSQLKGINSIEKKAFSAYFINFKELRNTKVPGITRKPNLNPKSSKDKNTDLKETKTNDNDSTYLRDTYLGCKEGRLSLAGLIKEPDQNPLLRKVAKNYFQALYSHLEGYDPSLFNEILSKQIEYFKFHKKYSPLHLFSFKLEKKQDLYYRILKGTNSYSFHPRKGFPPFEAFFSFEGKQTKKPMKFSAAPKLFLETFFSLDFTKEFCNEEFERQKKKVELKKEETIENVKDKAEKKMIGDIEMKIEFFDFSTSRPKKQNVCTDKSTNITVRETPLSEN